MKLRIIVFIFSVVLLSSCTEGQRLESKDGFTIMPKVKPDEALATYAGGCFWAMQECMIELKGVNKAISGYAGGTKANPTYDEVLSGNTGHAESVLVYYNPKIISFEKLTEAFFNSHDPTQLNRQGPDIGSDYRSIAFYRTPEERLIIQKIISRMDSAGGYRYPVTTDVIPFQVIYPAEVRHQDYYKKNTWNMYIRNVSKPKVMKLRKSMPDFIKPEYKD